VLEKVRDAGSRKSESVGADVHGRVLSGGKGLKGTGTTSAEQALPCRLIFNRLSMRLPALAPAAPQPPHVAEEQTQRLADLLRGRRVVVLSGAGMSTESGIPDYRGPETRKRARNPVQYNAFIGDVAARERYWMRSTAGWPRFSQARPNAAHRALAELERSGVVSGVITQNVDRLHQRAGSQHVVELHGSMAHVRCLGCRRRWDRAAFQARLSALNPAVAQATQGQLAPDGDAEVGAAEPFVVPSCAACGGTLKPDVVFFGESVPKAKVDAAWQLYDAADVVLVAGSSLAVYSGFRFVHRAMREGKPYGIVTVGETRGDERAHVKIEAQLGEVLPRLARLLGA
jgi:NAD-dependent SIR2 family protein deacetylase